MSDWYEFVVVLSKIFYHFNRFGWRWAFIMQLPLFALSLLLTTYNLRYVTPVSSVITSSGKIYGYLCRERLKAQRTY